MKKPITYADWIEIFERFGNGDDTVLEEMDSGNFDLDAGTAQRFYIKAEEAYKTRKKLWLEKFQRYFENQNIKSVDDFGMLLLTGKKNLIPLSIFSDSKGFPEDLKIVFRKDLEEFVAEIKKSLKDSLPNTSKDKEKIILTINSFRLPENIVEKLDQNNNEEEERNLSTRRKIIF
ncbi:hypothetical protein [Chryseobacterium defluvii]|uniref:Uncharacterized protein n=1 Tax=Chryseobacterium defluvii TaxID=160396 RepID=A0A495SAU1_9FLAO|nr:hypothetical protein [Chryseobacterium defluvii]RKS96669.1 hypothetical protein BCF58_3100 [Chryseobacterium defluvii]